jgi:anti-sigma factor RsiW
MKDANLTGPCAGYEFEIVDLHEGALGPEQAGHVRAHIEGCARCRDWQAQYAALDAALARELPRPALPAGFSAKLEERLKELVDPATRRNLRAVVEREHDWMVQALKRSARRRAILGAAAGATVAVAAIALAYTLAPEALGLLRAARTTTTATTDSLAAVAVLGALAWSALRGVLPGVRLPR